MSTSRPTPQATERKSGFVVFLLFFFALIAPSPVWPAMGIRGFMLLAVLCLALLVHLLTTRRHFSLRFLVGAAVAFALASVPAFYWAQPGLAVYPIFIVSAALLVSQANKAERDAFVDVASSFLLALLIGAVVGYALAAAGVPPLSTFENTDGRTNYFFYTTFTNTFEETFIRPSGIYDEPGALSFFICITAYLRDATGRSRQTTLALLLLGFITFSVMHLIFFVFYILASQANLRRLMRLTLSVALLIAALFALGAGDVIQDRLLSRLELTDEGNVAGDTRTLLLLNAAVVLSSVDHAALMGASSDCTLNIASCIDQFGAMGENLLSPLVSQGLFLSWPYYVFLVTGVLSLARGRKGLLFFAVALLFVQRPYLLNLGYAVLGAIAFSVHHTSLGTVVAANRSPRWRWRRLERRPA